MILKKQIWLLVLVFVATGLFLGCGNKPVKDEDYVKDAIRIKLSATSDLNTYNNQSHTVVLALYELSDPNIFKQLLEDSQGIVRLLEGSQFDASALSRRRVIVQPGQSNVFYMDRVDGARYFGAVAGFYNLQGTSNFSRLYPISLKRETSYFWTKDKEPQMNIELILGRDGFISPRRKL